MTEHSSNQSQIRTARLGIAAAIAAFVAVILVMLGIIFDASLIVVLPLALIFIAGAGVLIGVSVTARKEKKKMRGLWSRPKV